MLIRTKLIAIGIFLFITLIGVGVAAKLSFSTLSKDFELVVLGATDSAESAQLASEGASSGSQQLADINTDMLQIVDGIKTANQRNKLISKKVEDISATLGELIETIDELSEEVYDEEALAILEEVSDEVGDIDERLKREALLNIMASSEALDKFAERIGSEANQVDALNNYLKLQVDISESSSASSESIQALAHQSSQNIIWQEKLIVYSLVALAFSALIITFIIVKVIVLPINKTVKLMKNIGEGEGDLTQRLEVSGKDEMALIAMAFNQFVSRIQHLIEDISESTEQLRRLSGETLMAMQEGDQAMQSQQSEVEQIATAVSEMNAASQDVAENANLAEGASLEVNQHTQSGQKVVGEAVSSVTHLVDEVENAVQVIAQLSDKSTSVNSVVDVIQSVSEQTNLLALNAAIEAARAGEHGRGFAVVADEVRALAAKVESSTSDIRDIIDEMLSMTDKAVSVMESSRVVSNETLEGSNQASEALSAITNAMHTVIDMNAQITGSANEQKGVTEQLNQRISQVHELSNHTSVQLSRTLATCQSLDEISQNLSGKLQQFKV